MKYLETNGVSLVLGLLSCGFGSQSQELNSQQACPAQNQTPQSTGKESGERFVIVTIAKEADKSRSYPGDRGDVGACVRACVGPCRIPAPAISDQQGVTNPQKPCPMA